MKRSGVYPTEGVDYWVHYKQLPPKIYAFVQSNGDGTFGIFLDPRRSPAQQAADLEHEVDHIRNEDLYNGKSIQEVERL